ncbi:MAG: hypothetical protein AAFR21_06200 [Pseudomonadota bacterium]
MGLLHGTAIAIAVDPDGPLLGALLRGPSGAGKSSLASSIIEQCPWRRSRLVADDQVEMVVGNGRWIARPPAVLAGQIELFGYGPKPIRSVGEIEIRLVFDLLPPGEGRGDRILSLTSTVPDADASGRPSAKDTPAPLHLPFFMHCIDPASKIRALGRLFISGQIGPDEAHNTPLHF